MARKLGGVKENECRWRFKNEPLKCMDCIAEKYKYRASYFAVYRNYNAGGATFLLGKENAVLVNVRAHALEPLREWAIAVLFKLPVSSQVSVFSSEYESEWNCRRNVLILTPRWHIRKFRGGKVHSSHLLMLGAETSDLVLRVLQ